MSSRAAGRATPALRVRSTAAAPRALMIAHGAPILGDLATRRGSQTAADECTTRWETGAESHHIRLAVADDRLGPLRDLDVNLTPDESFAIDAHPFRDHDGRWYLFFARDVLDDFRHDSRSH
ncbi:hypothetical protein [Labedella phragmitis]|uniref:hypothetical protein n=1 Tax=Labedella phragmitis TaxID=2498849 RepID=UPI001AA03C7C|nr:hypothetical protein [Labedella phragmitis]